jgi:hypothetical protein
MPLSSLLLETEGRLGMLKLLEEELWEIVERDQRRLLRVIIGGRAIDWANLDESPDVKLT